MIRERSRANAQVGITLNFSPAYPASDSPEDVAAAARHDGYSNRWFMDPLYKGSYPQDMWDLFGYQVPRVAPGDMEIIARPIDFLGVNNYTRGVIKYAPGGFLDYESLHPEGEYTAMDWEVYPQGLTDLLVRLHQDYNPGAIYITENGCAYEDILTPDGRVHDDKAHGLSATAFCGRAPGHGARRAAEGLFCLVVDGQFRVGLWLHPTCSVSSTWTMRRKSARPRTAPFMSLVSSLRMAWRL